MRIKKKLLKYCYGLLIIIGLFYLTIILILCYFGPINTIKVKHSLKKHPTNIVVSLTTTPYRIDTIKPVLDSIMRQSIKPTKIYVNIPWRFKRDNTEYVIPTWLKDYPNIYSNIIINRTEDYGPATKLLGALIREHDPNTIIITVDDDKTYAKHMVRDLAKQYLLTTYKTNYKHGAIFTGLGLNFLLSANNSLYMKPVILHNKPSLVLVGAYGVAYKRSFFKDDIFSLMKSLPLFCFLGDDLTISAYLLVHGIDIIKVSEVSYNLLSSRWFFKESPSSGTKDALSNGANGLATGSNETNYCHCLDFWLKHNKVEFYKAILTRSKFIQESFIADNFYISMTQFVYHYLEELIEFIPLVKKMIVVIMD